MCNLAFTTDQLLLINSRCYVLRNTLKPRLKDSIENDKFRDSLRIIRHSLIKVNRRIVTSMKKIALCLHGR